MLLQREGNEGKLNIVSLLVHHSGGSMSIEMAKLAVRKSILTTTRDLLRLVLREESVIPKQCKEVFWKICKLAHFFYFETDGYSSPKEMVRAVDALIYEPIKLPSY
jgi:ent-kaurene synthase